jgi:hypothetical protein
MGRKLRKAEEFQGILNVDEDIDFLALAERAVADTPEYKPDSEEAHFSTDALFIKQIAKPMAIAVQSVLESAQVYTAEATAQAFLHVMPGVVAKFNHASGNARRDAVFTFDSMQDAHAKAKAQIPMDAPQLAPFLKAVAAADLAMLQTNAKRIKRSHVWDDVQRIFNGQIAWTFSDVMDGLVGSMSKLQNSVVEVMAGKLQGGTDANHDAVADVLDPFLTDLHDWLHKYLQPKWTGLNGRRG